MDLPTFKQLANELSEITGESVTEQQLKQFCVPTGTFEKPTVINSKLSGYSAENFFGTFFGATFYLNMPNEKYNKTEMSKKHKINEHTAQTINTDNTSTKSGIVQESLYALVPLYQNPLGGTGRMYNRVFSFNPIG